MTDSTIAFIGLGLIGGSIARGIKREKPDTKIMAYMRTRSRLLSALDEGVIDVILDGVNEQLSECDLIFLCTPVEYNARYLAEIKPFLKPGAIITDVGSTKTDIHEAVTRLGMEDCFIGGHPMAAGLSLEKENIDEFRRMLNEEAELTEDDFVRKIWIDVPMPLDYINEPLIEELELLEPFGQGNEKPQFAQKDLLIRSVRVLGKNKNLVKMSLVTENGLSMDGLLFADGPEFERELAGRNRIDIVYYPDVNEYNGTRTLQAVIKNYKIK